MVKGVLKTKCILGEKSYKGANYLKGTHKITLGGKQYVQYFNISCDDNGAPIMLETKDGVPILYINIVNVAVDGQKRGI